MFKVNDKVKCICKECIEFNKIGYVLEVTEKFITVRFDNEISDMYLDELKLEYFK